MIPARKAFYITKSLGNQIRHLKRKLHTGIFLKPWCHIILYQDLLEGTCNAYQMLPAVHTLPIRNYTLVIIWMNFHWYDNHSSHAVYSVAVGNKNSRVLGLNPTWGMAICVHFFVLSCIDTSWLSNTPTIQNVLPDVEKSSESWHKNSPQPKTHNGL